MAGSHMIRMPILPVRHRDGAGTLPADDVDGRSHHVRRIGNRAVGPLQVFAPHRTEQVCGRIGLEPALLDGPIARQFAPRQIAQPHTMTGGCMPCDGAAKPDLDVVGMRPEHQQVNRHVAHRLDNRPACLQYDSYRLEILLCVTEHSPCV